jgi:hypothetical protein
VASWYNLSTAHHALILSLLPDCPPSKMASWLSFPE